MREFFKGNSTQMPSLSISQEPKTSFGLAIYISDHGFGHASRNIPIIRCILEANKNIRIIIKTGEKQGQFIKDLIGDFNSRVQYYFEPMDVGLILKDNSLDIDEDKLKISIEEYIDSWDERIANEKEFLHYNNVDLVVSDIVPWIFKASSELNIKSVLISNFTWVDIYKEYLGKELVDKYIQCYKLANKALFYELYMRDMKAYIYNYEEVSLCSRDFDLEQVDKIKKSFNKPLVYLSVGRSVDLKGEIDVSNLNYDFIVTEGIKLKGHNVYYLPKETSNTQDYLMASDYVITKAGWGTISEALLGKMKIAVLSRDNVAEDRNTINKLKDMKLGIEVNYDEGFNLDRILRKLENLEVNYDKYDFRNDYSLIGEKIISYMEDRINEQK